MYIWMPFYHIDSVPINYVPSPLFWISINSRINKDSSLY